MRKILYTWNVEPRMIQMGFIDILKGVIIAFIGGFLVIAGFFVLALPTFLEMYFPWFAGIRPYSLPLAVIMLVFGTAILIYGQKKAGI
jgi:hypothetical protein